MQVIVTASVDERQLAAFYLQALSDGTLGIAFPSGPPSVSALLAFWLSRPLPTLGAYRVDRDQAKLFGLIWVNSMINADTEPFCDCGFCFLADGSIWEKAAAIKKAVQLALRSGVKHILGVIPEVNMPARALVNRCGFQLVGRLPGCVRLSDGKHVAGLIYYYVGGERGAFRTRETSCREDS